MFRSYLCITGTWLVVVLKQFQCTTSHTLMALLKKIDGIWLLLQLLVTAFSPVHRKVRISDTGISLIEKSAG